MLVMVGGDCIVVAAVVVVCDDVVLHIVAVSVHTLASHSVGDV